MSGPDLWDLANDFAEAAERYLGGEDNAADLDLARTASAAFGAGVLDIEDMTDVALSTRKSERFDKGVLLGPVVKQALRRARERCS